MNTQQNTGRQKVLMIVVLCFAFGFSATAALAALTFSSNTVSSDGTLTLTGNANSTWDVGLGHTLSLQTTNNGPITTGTGLFQVGGSLAVGTTSAGANIHSLSTTEQLRLGYNATNYNSFTVDAPGNLTIAATGTNPNIILTPGGTGTVSTTAGFSAGSLSVGSGATLNSVDAAVAILRTLTKSGSNGHGFSDSTDVTLAGGADAYNSFDGRVDILGTANYDHYAAFQSAPTYNSSGTITNVYGLFVANPQKLAGTVTNNYGVYISLQNAGSTNYGIYVAGAGMNVFEGKVGIGTTPTYLLDVHGASPRLYLYDTGTSYTMTKFSGAAGTNVFVGRESSTGGSIFTGTGAYSAVFGLDGTASLHLVTGSTVHMTMNNAGAVSFTSTVAAAGYLVGATAGVDKTCTGAPTAMTVTKGIITSITCP